MTFNPSDLTAVAPEIAVLGLAIAVLLIELVITRREVALQAIAALGVVAVMAVTVLSFGYPTHAFSGMIARDGVACFMKLLIGGIALLVVLMSRDYLRGVTGVRHGEYYCLLLLATFGMMILASATNLVTMFLGIETMSLALYVLAGLRTERPRSSEAALKYFLLGAFSTGFLLYGMALVYGATGGMTNLAQIGAALADSTYNAPLHLYAGVGLLMVGLLFKVAAVPFHFWSPDVYQGAPTPVTAFMSAGPKAAAFIALIRLFGQAFPDISEVWVPVLWVVSVATMSLGNIIALAQSDLKRMLAYSSIAHAGYLLIAVISAANPDIRSDATAGLMFYLLAYYLMNIGAFAVAILINRARTDADYQIDDYQGLASKYPLVSAAMAVFMISLAGIPPTAGFFGKFYLFSAGVHANLIWLVVIAVLNSAVSAFYYLRIVVYMYMRPLESEVKVSISPIMAAVLVICSLGIIKLGVFPGDMMNWARDSARKMVVTVPQMTESPPSISLDKASKGVKTSSEVGEKQD